MPSIRTATVHMLRALAAVALLGALAGCDTIANDWSNAPTNNDSNQTTTISVAENGVLDMADFFSERDLEQTADTSSATKLTVESGQELQIEKEGVYVISGTATDCTIHVSAGSSDKVQLVLDGVDITNASAPCIYVESADKVFVTTASDSSLTVSGSMAYGADSSADAVIFSRTDLVLNGTAALSINASDNGVVGKDDLKIAGGTYSINAKGHALEANDVLAIAKGTLSLVAGKDALHASNSNDASLGNVYIADGTISINSSSDGIHADSVVQIDGGTVSITSPEGIEGTYVQINGGTVSINATEDGINATVTSAAYATTLEITGGSLEVNMGVGDTDALDSNGDLIISGGTVSINATFAFDFDGTVTFTGGTVYVNGEEQTTITNSMMNGARGQN